MRSLSPKAFASLALLLLVAAFLAIITWSTFALRGARIDLTENQRFTLTSGTIEVLKDIEEPITIRFFYSERQAKEFPPVRLLGDRIREMLLAYADRSGGKLKVEVIDPQPFTPEEDLAQALGVQGVKTREGGDTLYLGIVGTNSIDGRQVIPFFPLEREAFLEYDLTQLVHALDTMEELKIGIVTNLNLDTGPGGIAAAMQGQSEPYALYAQLTQTFDVEMLEQEFAAVPDDIDILVIAHPKPLDDQTLYAIDQFVMRGGRVIAFLDPFSEMAQAAPSFGGQQEEKQTSSVDSLGPLLEAWGVEFKENGLSLVGDRNQAIRVARSAAERATAYVLWLTVRKDQMDPADPVTANLNVLQLGSSGALAPVDGATTTFAPLVASTRDSMLVDVSEARFDTPADKLLLSFEADDEIYTLAARLAGPVKSAFPNGSPAAVAGAASGETPEGQAAPASEHRAETDGPANIIVVADADMFDDRFWVEVRDLLNQRVYVPNADNGNFVLAAIENMAGSNALIALRARERTDRPFTVVERLRREAEQSYLAEEQRLEQRLQDLERQLRAAQGQQGPIDPQTGEVALSPEARAAVETFRVDIAETRAQLREVQRVLRSDIDSLENTLRFVNLALMPLLVAGFAIGLAVYRGRKRAQRSAASG